MTTVSLLRGDGIGPEIVESVQQIFSAAQVPVQWEIAAAGKEALAQHGSLLPDSTLESIRRNRVALKGPLETPVGTGHRSLNVSLRQEFDLYINLRPVRNLPGVFSRYEGIDLVLFRENTEGLYAGLEVYDERLEMADAVMRITRRGSLRIAQAAFEYARAHGRKKVTVLHKANILKQTSGLFLRCAQEVAREYPDIQFQDLIIDNAFMQLVQRPERFDVLLTTNMFGDIVSDLLAGLVGGLGVVAGANLGPEVALFEAVHGTAPDIAGQGKANPTGLLLAAIMMLKHLSLPADALRVENALMSTLAQRELCTPDLGGPLNTSQFTQAVIRHLNLVGETV